MMKLFTKLMYRIEKKDKAFVSQTDKFMQQFDQDHPKRSDSQLAEIAKHRNIFNRETESRIKW